MSHPYTFPDPPPIGLTLWPEWAIAFTQLGKRLENRTRKPDRRIPPGRWIALAAGASWGGKSQSVTPPAWAFEPVWERARNSGWTVPETGARRPAGARWMDGTPASLARVRLPPRRKLFAVARLERASQVDGDGFGWEAGGGQWAWRFDAVLVLPEPIFASGRQGPWELPADVLEQLRAAWPSSTTAPRFDRARLAAATERSRRVREDLDLSGGESGR